MTAVRLEGTVRRVRSAVAKAKASGRPMTAADRAALAAPVAEARQLGAALYVIAFDLAELIEGGNESPRPT